MHYLLQVVIRKMLPKNVSLALIRLGNFFRAICSKVIRRRDIDTMQLEINEIECDIEKIFPPTFFDIMVHFPIHLVNEIKLGGLAHLRWMYPTERNMCKYKAFVRNRAHPESSIAEGFLAEECLNFYLRYLHDGVKSRLSRYQYEDDEVIETEGDNLSPIFPNIGHPIGSKKKRKDYAVPMTLLYWHLKCIKFFMWRIQMRKIFIMQGPKSLLICMIWRKKIVQILEIHFGVSSTTTLVHQIDYPTVTSYGREKMYLVMLLICHFMHNIHKI